jgi:hypothetical protein
MMAMHASPLSQDSQATATAGRTRWRSVSSAVVALALAFFVATFFTQLSVLWNPGQFGDFGLSLDWYPQTVDWLDPGSPADLAGIKVGDVIDRPAALQDRVALVIRPRPGERVAISVSRANAHRTVTLQARPFRPLPSTDRALLILKGIWGLTFLSVGLVLVLLRPSLMTWGFYLFALNVVLVFGPDPTYFLSHIPANWVVAMLVVFWVVAPAGLAGFVMFCVRFPSNRPAAWGRALEGLAAGFSIVAASLLIYSQISAIQFAHVPIAVVTSGVAMCWALVVAGAVVLLNAILSARGLSQRAIRWSAVATVCVLVVVAVLDVWHRMISNSDIESSLIGLFILGTVAFLMTYVNARGLERHRIKWVAFGLVCALVASAVDLIWTATAANGITIPKWDLGLESLYIALPITVAYAVIRHRVIDVRFVASRSIVYGAIGLIVVVIAAALDWLFTTRLPSSRFETATYIGVALAVGLSLNAVRRALGTAVDSLLFRRWHHTAEQVRTISDGISHTHSERDLYDLLTTRVANAFSLASVALFERVEGGGFVRVAAHGWPPNTIWHILADDPLVVGATKGQRVLEIGDLFWREHDLPAGVARPALLFPIIVDKRVSAMLLCGAHENGTALDPDERRAFRRLCDAAATTYKLSPSAEWERGIPSDRQIQPLRA